MFKNLVLVPISFEETYNARSESLKMHLKIPIIPPLAGDNVSKDLGPPADSKRSFSHWLVLRPRGINIIIIVEGADEGRAVGYLYDPCFTFF